MKKLKIEIYVDPTPEAFDKAKQVIEHAEKLYDKPMGKAFIDTVALVDVVSVYGIKTSDAGIDHIPFWARRIINKIYKSNL